ncbi:MAG: ImmA/IrrE family metallo-endopeptidase [Gemmataceae bacterium]|nr:ImmA/IrrE family metallo-endopeptidase [Gemmataceae bacterium]
MVTGHGITVAREALPFGVQGVSMGGRILLRPDLTPAQAFAVLVHEYSHELLHRNQRTASKTVRETEAEAIAYVVCRAVGLDPTTACADYIQLYRGNSETLAASLQIIQQTASGIIVHVRSSD